MKNARFHQTTLGLTCAVLGAALCPAHAAPLRVQLEFEVHGIDPTIEKTARAQAKAALVASGFSVTEEEEEKAVLLSVVIERDDEDDDDNGIKDADEADKDTSKGNDGQGFFVAMFWDDDDDSEVEADLTSEDEIQGTIVKMLDEFAEDAQDGDLNDDDNDDFGRDK